MISKKVTKEKLKKVVGKWQAKETGKQTPVGMAAPKRGMKNIANKKAKKA